MSGGRGWVRSGPPRTPCTASATAICGRRSDRAGTRTRTSGSWLWGSASASPRVSLRSPNLRVQQVTSVDTVSPCARWTRLTVSLEPLDSPRASESPGASVVRRAQPTTFDALRDSLSCDLPLRLHVSLALGTCAPPCSLSLHLYRARSALCSAPFRWLGSSSSVRDPHARSLARWRTGVTCQIPRCEFFSLSEHELWPSGRLWEARTAHPTAKPMRTTWAFARSLDSLGSGAV